MRLLVLLSAGLLAAACGLSFNPDLPSSSSNDEASGDGDGLGLESGDGDTVTSHGEDACDSSGGAGGQPSPTQGGACSEDEQQ